ncbi:BadF/BadG/BcrA/BcrD ATPase family protein [Actinoplanes sp. NPDC051411]|uniref:N-acetylglucosamine kinase n=1 Tax=Actinoplanes sp. NPDC051411 TaxID=3155522 RepID=UPI00343B7A2A
MEVVLGIDVGGTGLRAALAPASGEPVPIARAGHATGLRRGAGGLDGVVPAAAAIAAELLARDEAGDEAGGEHRVRAVALGCAGAADLGDELRVHLPAALRAVCGPAIVVVASDMVTAFFGALAGSPGVTLSVGTGAVAFGGDLAGEWRRADGRGDILGDLGGGAWLGRAGMVAALRASDGRRGGSPVLLRRLLSAYGEPAALIRELNGRTDRAAVLAGFAPAVLDAARSGDPAALEIRAEAGRHLADTALAARPRGLAGRVALTVVGGLPDHHADFRAELVERLDPGFAVRPAAGPPVDGALRLAADAAAGRVPPGLAHYGVQMSG